MLRVEAFTMFSCLHRTITKTKIIVTNSEISNHLLIFIIEWYKITGTNKKNHALFRKVIQKLF